MTKYRGFFLAALAITAILLAVSLADDKGIISLTGLASSGTATASVNLSEETSVRITGNVDFGTGRVDSDATNATLDSNAGTVTGGSWTPTESYINIENDGTVNISINVSSDISGAAEAAPALIGGTGPLFQLKGNITEANSCSGLAESFTDVPNSTNKVTICSLLNFAQTSDEFNVSVRIVIPNDAEAGSRNTTLSFSASKT